MSSLWILSSHADNNSSVGRSTDVMPIRAGLRTTSNPTQYIWTGGLAGRAVCLHPCKAHKALPMGYHLQSCLLKMHESNASAAPFRSRHPFRSPRQSTSVTASNAASKADQPLGHRPSSQQRACGRCQRTLKPTLVSGADPAMRGIRSSVISAGSAGLGYSIGVFCLVANLAQR
jgi:hypothetical protein